MSWPTFLSQLRTFLPVGLNDTSQEAASVSEGATTICVKEDDVDKDYVHVLQ